MNSGSLSSKSAAKSSNSNGRLAPKGLKLVAAGPSHLWFVALKQRHGASGSLIPISRHAALRLPCGQPRALVLASDENGFQFQGGSPGSGKAAAGLRGGNTAGARGKTSAACACTCGGWGIALSLAGPSSGAAGGGAGCGAIAAVFSLFGGEDGGVGAGVGEEAALNALACWIRGGPGRINCDPSFSLYGGCK